MPTSTSPSCRFLPLQTVITMIKVGSCVYAAKHQTKLNYETHFMKNDTFATIFYSYEIIKTDLKI